MLLSLAVDTFRENKKNLLLWGAGLMLTVIFAAIFWPEDLVISSVMDADSSFGLGWQWHSFWKYLQIFLLPGYVSIFSIIEGSRLLAGRTAIGRLTLLMAYPLRRWQLLAARVPLSWPARWVQLFAGRRLPGWIRVGCGSSLCWYAPDLLCSQRCWGQSPPAPGLVWQAG